jgi:hypothetical protein
MISPDDGTDWDGAGLLFHNYLHFLSISFCCNLDVVPTCMYILIINLINAEIAESFFKVEV